MTDSQTGSSYQSAPNSTMAIIALIMGILGLTLLPIIGSIAALVTGYIARKEIRESNAALGGGGMVTVGLVLGWIGVGLTVIGGCIGIGFFLLTFCLIPLGLSFNQFGAAIPVLMAIA